MCANKGRTDKSNVKKMEQMKKAKDRMETKGWGQKYVAGFTEFR